jgi:hypothetical protein
MGSVVMYARKWVNLSTIFGGRPKLLVEREKNSKRGAERKRGENEERED